MNAIQFPLSRITVAFIFGILVAHFSNVDFIWATLLIAISFGTFCIAYFWSQKQFIQNNIFGFTTYFFSFCLGMYSLTTHSSSNQKDNYLNQIQSTELPHQAEIILREKLKSTLYYDRYIGLVSKIDQSNCSGKIILNIEKNSLRNHFQIGTTLHVFSVIIPHKPPLNPNQFDYGQYLTNKSILAQTYVGNLKFKVQPIIIEDLFYYSDAVRSKILLGLQKVHFSSVELSVLAALILGQQQEISQDIIVDYQKAGAIHILSVSGLHVGFIVLFLGFVLKYLPKVKWVNYFKLAFILLVLWGFAFIAGLSPSVIRSVTMFSFVAIGLHLKRKTNMFHTLLVSLLLILLFDPSFLFDVGFQLSYLALFFILWLQPLLSSIWEPEHKITKYFWDILTVSFAAQLGTVPISIYYFHQFPGLFFVTNLIIIPFLSVIMALGLLLMILILFDLAPLFLAQIVEKSIALLNDIIHRIASFDQMVLTDIPFNSMMVLSCYLLLIAGVLYCKRPSFQRITFVTVGVLLLQASFIYTRWATENKSELIVFNIKRSTLIAERNGEEVTLFKDTETDKYNPIQPYLTANFSKVVKENPVPNLMYVFDKKIVIIESSSAYPKNVRPDILIMRQSPRINLNRVFQTCRPKLVIADASNFRSYSSLWQSTCIKEKIPFHNTYEKGFYKLEK
ncbi:MAG: ComEC/Rec2 family competence protein [Flavobacterium sp.]|nr:ComEC/Rec2 family competence protein [Flavobacterium sp.]